MSHVDIAAQWARGGRVPLLLRVGDCFQLNPVPRPRGDGRPLHRAAQTPCEERRTSPRSAVLGANTRVIFDFEKADFKEMVASIKGTAERLSFESELPP